MLGNSLGIRPGGQRSGWIYEINTAEDKINLANYCFLLWIMTLTVVENNIKIKDTDRNGSRGPTS